MDTTGADCCNCEKEEGGLLEEGKLEAGERGGWHKASVSDCLPLAAAPIGLSPLLILTLCGPERLFVVCVGGRGSVKAGGACLGAAGLQCHVLDMKYLFVEGGGGGGPITIPNLMNSEIGRIYRSGG